MSFRVFYGERRAGGECEVYYRDFANEGEFTRKEVNKIPSFTFPRRKGIKICWRPDYLDDQYEQEDGLGNIFSWGCRSRQANQLAYTLCLAALDNRRIAGPFVPPESFADDQRRARMIFQKFADTSVYTISNDRWFLTQKEILQIVKSLEENKPVSVRSVQSKKDPLLPEEMTIEDVIICILQKDDQ